MKTAPTAHQVALGFTALAQDKLLETATTMLEVAPTSPLHTDPVIAAGVTDITQRVATLKNAATATAKARAALDKNVADESAAQTALATTLTGLAVHVQGIAKTELEITGMAFTVRERIKLPRTTPHAPEAIDITTPPGARAYATVSVHETGGLRGRYVAESATDPDGPWTMLVGTGKSRTLTAPSGSQVWVRFARVRGQLQSAWSAPILVYIP